MKTGTALERAIARSKARLARHGVTILDDDVFDPEFDDPETWETRRLIVTHLLSRKHIQRKSDPQGWIADTLGLEPWEILELSKFPSSEIITRKRLWMRKKGFRISHSKPL